MPIASRLNTFALAAALLAGVVTAAQAELPTMEFESSPTIYVGVNTQLAQIGHRRPHAIVVPHDARQDPFARNEEEFDRKFGMCRRC